MDESAVEVLTSAGPALRADVADLLQRTVRPDGSLLLSEDRRRALARDPGGADRGFVAVTARDPGSGRLVGYAQADHQGDRTAWSLETVVPPGGDPLVDRLVDAALDALRTGDGGRVRLWVGHAGDADDLRAGARGFVVERDLLQLRCPLPPTGSGPPPVTRPFRVGADEEAWLVANNRAFADHPEQGHWDLATLEAREAEPWFDPDGFRVLDVDGRIAGSCWTKVHGSTVPPMGEIYVISVDPDFHGRGWGRGLTLAGLDWLAGAGLTTGMLYVDAANTAAVGLYRSMGFTVHHVDRAYVLDLTGGPG